MKSESKIRKELRETKKQRKEWLKEEAWICVIESNSYIEAIRWVLKEGES